MGRSRRSTRSSYSYYRRAPYNLRSRSRRPNYVYDTDRSTSEKKKPVDLVKVEDFSLQSDENSRSHHTDMYEVDELVLRRGQQVHFNMKLSRALGEKESVHVMFLTGRNPYPSKGTLLSFTLAAEKNISKFGWQFRAESNDDISYDLYLTPSPEAIIGLYEIVLQVCAEEESKSRKLKDKFYLIFNPWCEQDVVYLKGDAEREEYVMNDTGRVWIGSRTSNYGKPWVFGQFESCAIEAAKYILEISDLNDNALSNPVIVSRTFSKMSNSFDDDGILQGNWSGDYSGGTEPSDWISSVDILTEYLETGKEVKYGQCWVFSALLTTLFRAVGIPARSITNFESAHDNDGSMTIDRHWDSDDKPLEDLNDSIWNFHVWNEVWFKRNDLPDGHDGWQVIDGTPQERSEGVMQCGPTSVNAIRNGEVYLPYDTKFVIAEVNGDIIEWVKDNKSGEMEPVWVEPHSIGFSISTKAVGSPVRRDVTDLYKYKEGSDEERSVVSRLAKFRKDELEPFYKLRKSDTVKFELSGTGTSSGDITVLLLIQSSERNEINVHVTLTLAASYYNGMSDDELKTVTKNMKVAAKDSSSFYVTMEGKDYLNKIATDATIAVFCQAKVMSTGQRFFQKESFAIDRPDLRVTAPYSVEKGEEFKIDVSFENELSLALTECRLLVGGPGIHPVKPVKLYTSTIGAGETVHQTITLKAKSVGTKEIVAQLHTRQLQNITGSVHIDIQSA